MKPEINLIPSKLPRKRLIYEVEVRYCYGQALFSPTTFTFSMDEENRLKETLYVLQSVISIDTKSEFEKAVIRSSKALGWDAKLTKAFYDTYMVTDPFRPRNIAYVDEINVTFYDRICDRHKVEYEISE